MLVFAIAVGATAGLGLLALKFPAVRTALTGFSLWAGLFVQVAGVIEAMRRISMNPATAYTITPNVPVIGMTGVPQPRPSGPRPRPEMKQHPVQHPTVDRDPSELEMNHLESGFARLRTDDIAADPTWLERFTNNVNRFVHFTPDGFKDVEANHADPLAQRALALIRRAEDLVHPSPPQPPPLDAADVTRYGG